MSEVWLVGAGQYSDYRVLAVFSTKELAEAYIAHMSAERRRSYEHEHGPYFDYPDYRAPEPFELDGPKRLVEDGERIYRVHWDIGKDHVWVDVEVAARMGDETLVFYDGKPHSFSTWVKTTNYKRAIKIGNDRRIVALAGGKPYGRGR